MSALASDNRSFILFTTYFTFNTNFSSQQSEVTTAVVFSYKTSTRHLPPLGATADVITGGNNYLVRRYKIIF